MSIDPDPVKLAASVFNYLELDAQTYTKVVTDDSLPSKLAVGMISTASSALDFYSWLMYADRENEKRFESLITDSRGFFRSIPDFSPQLVYKVIRCGVVHQFYPKQFTPLIAIADNNTLVCYKGTKSINAFGFLQSTLTGLREAQKSLDNTTSDTYLQQMRDRVSNRIHCESNLILAPSGFSWPTSLTTTRAPGTTPPPIPQRAASNS